MRKGLLPENLPAIFTSVALDDVLDELRQSRYLVTQSRKGKMARFNASKRGQQRRLFSVPHPLFHHDASLFFEKNWDAIARIYSGSKGSASKPVFPVGGFRAVDITPQGSLPTLRLRALARKRFCLITDVSRCFPSIYTHAIPWALDGKTAAKADRKETSTAVRGNRLDFILRQSQDGQTAGIPVGPDTSRLVSELILSRIDADHLQLIGRKAVHYVRHVDDYWIGGDTIEECQGHLYRLRSGLGEYQLDINEAKTRIVPLAEAIGESWPSELRRQVREGFGHQPRSEDVTALLAQAVDRAVASQDDGIIKYVIRQIDSSHAWDIRWDVLESFLAHAAIQFPHSFDYVARVVAWRARLQQGYDKGLWKDVILTVARNAAELGHDSELVWALWLIKELKLRLNATQVAGFARNSGPLVLALLARMTVTGLTTKTSLLDDLQAQAVGDDQFGGAMWPLSLELYHLGHHNRLDAHRPPGNDVIALWHAAKVSIIDWNRLPGVFDEADGDPEPDHALEDYASAYEGDDDHDGEDDMFQSE
jgi:hypothetical protein